MTAAPAHRQLDCRHQRFVAPGWARYLRGLQTDTADRYVASAAGDLTPDADKALVIDADAEPMLFSNLNQQFERQFYSPHLQRWV